VNGTSAASIVNTTLLASYFSSPSTRSRR
jgi:hypothetical protein